MSGAGGLCPLTVHWKLVGTNNVGPRPPSLSRAALTKGVGNHRTSKYYIYSLAGASGRSIS